MKMTILIILSILFLFSSLATTAEDSVIDALNDNNPEKARSMIKERIEFLGNNEGGFYEYLKMSQYTIYLIGIKKIKKYQFGIQICNDALDTLIPQLHSRIYLLRADFHKLIKKYDLADQDHLDAIKNLEEHIPENAFTAYTSYSLFLSTCENNKYRDANKAMFYAKKAVSAQPNPLCFTALSSAYASKANFEQARKIQEKAITKQKEIIAELVEDKELKADQKESKIKHEKGILNLLEAFHGFLEEGKPWREKLSEL